MWLGKTKLLFVIQSINQSNETYYDCVAIMVYVYLSDSGFLLWEYIFGVIPSCYTTGFFDHPSCLPTTYTQHKYSVHALRLYSVSVPI